jgi:tripartite-type tricarboxylate transporter receptor subunit TctC
LQISRRTLLTSAAAIGAAAIPAAAVAQRTTVDKTARIFVGFPPGGSLDTIARLLAERLKGSYAPTVLVENRAGASGRIAMEAAKAADPDGSTIVLAPASVAVLYPHVYRRLTYDPLKDFAPVSTLCTFQFALTAGPMVPSAVGSLSQFAQWCKLNPAQAAFASPGEGTIAHLAGLMIGRAFGLSLQHVPFKGGAPALQAALGGHVAASINVLFEPLQFIKDGSLRCLAVTGPARAAQLPHAQTVVEQGHRDLEIQEYFAAWLPPRTPPTIAQALAVDLARALNTNELKEFFAQRDLTAIPSTPQGMDRRIREDLERWKPIVRSTGFTLDS